MTRTKAWRLSLTFILMFGWLFLTPAYSDDPLSVAAEEIAELNKKVVNLTEEADTRALIDIAEDKYDAAVAAKTARDAAYEQYDAAVAAEATALSEKTTAQNAVDGQTATVAAALTHKNDAQDALDVANVNLSNTPVPSNGGQGVAFQIYPMVRSGSTAVLPPNPGLICQGSIPTFYTYAGDWAICGASQNMIGIFTATLTVPNDINDVYFAAYTDDGSRIYVDGVLESSLWREQGATWSPYTRHFDTTIDKTLQLEVWWYNGGGPGVVHLGWGHSGIWSGIPSQFLSYGQGSSQEVFAAYNAAVAAQQAAQATYDDKLSIYNSAVSTLNTYNQTLTTKTTEYDNAVINTSNKLTAKNNAQSTYDQAIIDMNDAIQDAWDLYNETYLFEEQQRVAAAISAAMANQPQPTPETTVEPSPEPSPEQTQPDDPTPEPTPETTDEATPEPTPEPEISPEPEQEPSPQPTDIDQEPTPEPKPTPAEPSEESSRPNVITEETANLIADLTSKDTLTKLSPEQKAAVAQGLGIKASELAKVVALAASDKSIAQALEEFGDRIKENASAPMPYTLADATTEVATEAFLSDPIGAITDIDFEKLFSPSEWGKDMTDDQREKAQEVVVPVIIAGNIVAAAMTRRI